LVILPIIDTEIPLLQERLNSLYEVTNRLHFFLPQNILMFSKEDIIKKSYDFQLFYKADINIDITRQILCMKNMFKNTLKTKHYIVDLLQCILDNDIPSAYIIF